MVNTYEPLIRVMGLHSITYCERLYYLEEVEKIEYPDASVYAGRALHEKLEQEEEEAGQCASIHISSEALGLTGKADCLRKRNGEIIPYEHKRGRSRRVNKKATPWKADALQVSAYGMLLEEYTGEAIKEGRIHYHKENVTVKVPLDEKARADVVKTIDRARELRNSLNRPPVTDNDRLCIKCSMAPVCLPEEERLACNKEWEPVRLFPPDREGKSLHITEHGVRISRSGDTLCVKGVTGGDKKYPITDISSLVLHGYPQITTQALHFCARKDIAVHWISAGGYYVTGIVFNSGSVQRKLRQYKALSDEPLCLDLTRKVAMAKVEGSLRYLLRATRGTDRKATGLSEPIEEIRSALKNISKAERIDSVRGYEGIAGKAYFSVLPSLLKGETPEELKFSKRSRRPPKDRFNAILSFGYSLLYQAVMQAIITVGLEPAIGFYHTPRSSAHPLVMDIMELFRVTLWDMMVIGSINRGQWDINEDFSVTREKVWLSDKGRKKAITLFEKRLEETWKHPVIGYSLSYARLIELEVKLLEKEWSGQVGLFAKMRLR